MLLSALGATGFLVVTVLPGAWLGFGIALPGLGFWPRMLASCALSPIVVVAQFYLLRLLAIPFDQAVLVIAVANLPAAYLLWKWRREITIPSGWVLAGVAFVFAVTVAGLGPQLLDAQARAYTGHGWMHTDIIYMLANGELIPEETSLAGLRLAYPWAGHVPQAVLSRLLDSPPVSSFIWTNLAWLAIAAGFSVLIISELGGATLAKVTAPAWLFFGVNFLGYPLSLGDYRYTPWAFEYVFFSQMPFALGLFIGFLYLLLWAIRKGVTGSWLALTGLVLLSLGLIYPFLLPPSMGLAGIWLVVHWFRPGEAQAPNTRPQLIRFAVVLLLAGVVSLLHYRFITAERGVGLLEFPPLDYLARKLLDSLVAPAPLYAGLAMALIPLWKRAREATVLLVAGGLTSLALYAFLHIPPVAEYKFMFTAAVCLAPFPSLALERLGKWLGKPVAYATPLMILLVAAPLVHKMATDWPWAGDRYRPTADLDGFELSLAPGEANAGLFAAIRALTPVESVLVTSQAAVNLPTLASRPLYVQPGDNTYGGINVNSDHLMVDIRGYDPALIASRRQDLAGLFNAPDSSNMADSLANMQSLQRPLALIVDRQQDARLLDWLTQTQQGQRIFEEDGLVLWLVGQP